MVLVEEADDGEERHEPDEIELLFQHPFQRRLQENPGEGAEEPVGLFTDTLILTTNGHEWTLMFVVSPLNTLNKQNASPPSPCMPIVCICFKLSTLSL